MLSISEVDAKFKTMVDLPTEQLITEVRAFLDDVCRDGVQPWQKVVTDYTCEKCAHTGTRTIQKDAERGGVMMQEIILLPEWRELCHKRGKDIVKR